MDTEILFWYPPERISTKMLKEYNLLVAQTHNLREMQKITKLPGYDMVDVMKYDENDMTAFKAINEYDSPTKFSQNDGYNNNINLVRDGQLDAIDDLDNFSKIPDSNLIKLKSFDSEYHDQSIGTANYDPNYEQKYIRKMRQ